MAQYIDKSALVAEISRRKHKLLDNIIFERDKEWVVRTVHQLNRIIFFLDTLEVKEVDLEAEIDNFYGMYRKNGITFSIEDNQECLDWKVDCNPNFEKAFAKHFFELGMCINNSITAADRGTAEEIIISLKRVENDYRIDLTKEIEWVRNKVKKGKEV